MKNPSLCAICLSIVISLTFNSYYVKAQPLKPGQGEPEKIYLQLDNDVYTSNQTVWFKAIVTQASDHFISDASGVLYAELVDPNETIVEKKLIRLIQGIGSGFFQLNPNYNNIHYQIRAYTAWSKNFGPDFFFKSYIRVYGEGDNPEPDPVQNLTLTGTGNQRRVKASINPLVIDSLHSRDLTIFVSADDQQDTLKISRSGKNTYLLDYEVPAGTNFVTLKLQTKNSAGYSRTVVMDEHFLDLQFFPESGEMVHSLDNFIGFKALDAAGNGIAVSGDIITGKGQVLTTFTSNHLGMGSVLMTMADSTETYTARVTRPSGQTAKRYPLPKVAAKGNVLTVKRIRDRIYLRAASNYLPNDSIAVKASCRGQARYDFKGILRNGNWDFSIPTDMLPEGIIAFTLTRAGHTVAERLYFNERQSERLQLSLTHDKAHYTQREQTKLEVASSDSAGRPVISDISVLVLNQGESENRQGLRENILSYFLVSSDLRGRIESPGSYFTDSANRQDLDALLLTQGWRRYKYDKLPEKRDFVPEHRLAVTGYVGALLSQKKEKSNVPLTMMLFGAMPAAQTGVTDTLGRFSFDIDEQEGHTANLLIQSNNKSGQQRNYSVIALYQQV